MSDPFVAPWLTLIGLGEDGPAGLSDASRKALAEADVIFGGPRHLDLIEAGAKGRAWPIPFSIDPVLAERGRRVVVLASGDPFWHGAGGSLMRAVQPQDWTSHPASSVFSLLANRMGWKLEETLTQGLHAAPFERLRPLLAQNTQILCTLRDGAAPAELATWLTQQGFGASRLTIAQALGGPRERLFETSAQGFDAQDIAAPVAAAIHCRGDNGLSQASGLADDLFQSDGQITKRPIRALTLSTLAPRAGEVLWDIGGGSGSISVEWGLAARGACALTFEARVDRLGNINANAARFGLSHRITAQLGKAPDCLAGQPLPDCVFIGGGGSQALLDHLWQILPPGTRIVANGVTLETETLLMQAQAQYGGHLMKVEIAEVAPLGTMRGWDRARPVIQWSVTR
ncbi:precorrin-6y C5,15-methyltransferase (decarboxylating) subunit CbiE [Epibacterium ulvae]|uniref:precorrin-6y C5,15-methyltransferase (decarboxylating) subunit CbiE n=1 Tax=Epibacterium ulvae TaxID=1156985 RepID=UPI001BFC2AE2|nr:precorrin-6y C5,15-methyltransferase (decarboxylating) subunit CbiE [Epibacterium ulvae]MBT8154349.1 precorrin-6y C5,15-methyltransferase (decarboxylating) subunit CbiE [Epibacterium ulvae]